MQQAREALEIYERLGKAGSQAQCLVNLAWLLHDDRQLDLAEDTASRAINLLSEQDRQFLVCDCHHVLGDIYRAKGKTEEAIYHYQVALRIATSFSSSDQLFWIHFSLMELFSKEGRFDDALAQVEHAKSHAVNDVGLLSQAMYMQAWFWCAQRRFEEAKSEALRAVDAFEKLGATNDVRKTRKLLQRIDKGIDEPVRNQLISSATRLCACFDAHPPPFFPTCLSLFAVFWTPTFIYL